MKTIEPKAEFLKSPEAAAFAEALNLPIVRAGLRVAMEQFVTDQNREDTFEAAAKKQYELQGAKRFQDIFLNLTEPEEVKPASTAGVLQWHKKPQRPRPSRPTQPPAPQ